MSTTELRNRVLDQHVEIPMSNGTSVRGALEYFPSGHTLAVTDDIDNDPFMLTAPASMAPEITATLDADQVLLTNFVATRGFPEWLAQHGYVELVKPVKIGIFGLDAFVARVL